MDLGNDRWFSSPEIFGDLTRAPDFWWDPRFGICRATPKRSEAEVPRREANE